MAVAQAGSCSSDLTHSLGTSIYCGCSPKKNKRPKKKKKKEEEEEEKKKRERKKRKRERKKFCGEVKN